MPDPVFTYPTSHYLHVNQSINLILERGLAYGTDGGEVDRPGGNREGRGVKRGVTTAKNVGNEGHPASRDFRGLQNCSLPAVPGRQATKPYFKPEGLQKRRTVNRQVKGRDTIFNVKIRQENFMKFSISNATAPKILCLWPCHAVKHCYRLL